MRRVGRSKCRSRKLLHFSNFSSSSFNSYSGVVDNAVFNNSYFFNGLSNFFYCRSFSSFGSLFLVAASEERHAEYYSKHQY